MGFVGERTALVVVDLQGTFADDFPGAGLPVPGSGRRVDAIREFTVRAAASPDVVAVVTTQDWHPERLAGHIAEPSEEPEPARGVFPRHGVAGSPEAELHPRFDRPEVSHAVTDRVRKGQRSAAFSGFEGTDEQGRSLGEILHGRGVRRLLVYGFELANCVSATALDGAAAGYETVVVPELCSVLEPDRADETLAALRAGGVRLVDPAEAEQLLA